MGWGIGPLPMVYSGYLNKQSYPKGGDGGWLGLEIILTEQINYHQEMPPNI